MGKAFAAACKEFFGYRPGQGLREFALEIKALTPEDRVELAALLSKELGCEVTNGTITT